MNNIQDTLIFPVRDAESRKQFLIACAVMLAAFIVPILPSLIMMGYSAKVMRQVIEEKKNPTMPAWQGSDLSEMLTDGLRLYGAQIVLMLPLMLIMGIGMTFMMGSGIGFAVLGGKNEDSFFPVSMLLFTVGIFFFGIFGVLSLPYGVIVSAALPHVAVKRSFQAAFEFKEWFTIFRSALGQFILGYAVIMIASFIVAMVIQIAMITIILICIIPFLMVPFMAYQMLIMNTVFAQAYATGQQAAGQEALQTV